MKNLIWFVLCFIGCSEAATELTAWQKSMRDGSVETVAATKAVESKTDEAIGILRDNTTALAAIKSQIDSLEASVVSSTPNGKEVIQSVPPESPAKANTQQALLNVATPGTSSRVASDGTVLRWNVDGNWNPTILETSRHLGADHGINTNGMTHQEMADIHASIHDGKPVAMKSETVRYVSRGTNCPNGQCPTSSTRYVRRSRR
jgi:hypothetical protein